LLPNHHPCDRIITHRYRIITLVTESTPLLTNHHPCYRIITLVTESSPLLPNHHYCYRIITLYTESSPLLPNHHYCYRIITLYTESSPLLPYHHPLYRIITRRVHIITLVTKLSPLLQEAKNVDTSKYWNPKIIISNSATNANYQQWASVKVYMCFKSQWKTLTVPRQKVNIICRSFKKYKKNINKNGKI